MNPEFAKWAFSRLTDPQQHLMEKLWQEGGEIHASMGSYSWNMTVAGKLQEFGFVKCGGTVWTSGDGSGGSKNVTITYTGRELMQQITR